MVVVLIFMVMIELYDSVLQELSLDDGSVGTT